jgi:hypothetical protein
MVASMMYQRKQASPYQKFGFLGTDRLGCPDDLKRFEFDLYRVCRRCPLRRRLRLRRVSMPDMSQARTPTTDKAQSRRSEPPPL